MTSPLSAETLIADLRAITGEYGALLHEETNVIRTANFAHFVGMQDRKIIMHNRLTRVLEGIKTTPKSDEQRQEIRGLIRALAPTVDENKRMLEHGTNAIDRLMKRIMSAMRRSLQNDVPRYTAGGVYHQCRKKPLIMQTDQTA